MIDEGYVHPQHLGLMPRFASVAMAGSDGLRRFLGIPYRQIDNVWSFAAQGERMSLDVRTVVLLGSLLAAALALILVCAQSHYARLLRESMNLWVRGLLALLLAQVLFGLRDMAHDLLSIVLANTLTAAAFVGFALSVRRYLGIKSQTWPLWLPVVLIAAMMYVFTALLPGYVARVMVFSLGLSWILALLLRPLAGSLRRGGPVGQQVVAVTVVILIVTVLVRMLLLALGPAPVAGLLDGSVVNTVALTYMSLVPVLTTVGFLLMCNERLMDDTVRLSTVDVLTGAYSRRALTELSERALAEARRYRRPLSVLMIDADHFKQVNDTYGHSAGDAVLVEIMARLKATLRTEDFVGRIGGEEFLVVLPATPEEEAVRVASRIRERIAGATLVYGREEIPFTVSIGVAERDPGEANIDLLIKRADDAMYAAKRSGRNRVFAASAIDAVAR
jgi:diguanylate cyclase (GGDEF)-like protein